MENVNKQLVQTLEIILSVGIQSAVINVQKLNDKNWHSCEICFIA